MLQVKKTIKRRNVHQGLAYFEYRFDSNRTTGTPLHLAVKGGHVRVVVYLLRVGANVDKKDSQGWTPLDVAAEKDVSYFHFLFSLLRQSL